VYDLGGGVAAGAAETVGPSDIVSAPFLALIGGLTDARLRWAGPVGFDLRGFMSVVAHSAADDQRYGEPSFVLCSAEYVHFSSRLAYHFATVDAMCSPSDNRNYVRFLFHGGAATADRRECRAHFLATVLGRSGFEVKRKGDRLQADQGKRGVAGIREALGTVGRLLGSARQMDMVMDSRATAEAYAEAFLAGDPGFEFARGGTGSHARPERRS
jgi:pyruvate,water dikinase